MPEGIVLLAPVSRDGVQRGGDRDIHTAVHLIGLNGEVISHHLASHPLHLTMQRYANHLLFVKDFEEHPPGHENACLDDDWHHSYPRVAGWLLSAEDTAVPPMPLHLPSAQEGWSGSASSWSVVLARGNIEDLAPSRQLLHDTAPRLYLLEAGSRLRLWASRRVDDSYDTVFQRVTFDGSDLVRHSFGFTEVPGSTLELLDGSAFGAWALWSPDLQHAARIGWQSRKLVFWRCAVAFAGEEQRLKASSFHAYAMPAEAKPYLSSVGLAPLHLGWQRFGFSPEDATFSSPVSGLPTFPALRWQDADYSRQEDTWLHPVAKDASQHATSAVFR